MKYFCLSESSKGFTLIEILVSIAIIAIISAIGFVSYNQAQILGRDSRRKSDLRAIKVALQLYYQNNNRYPCPGDNTWNWSTTGGNWITDAGSTDCGASAQVVLDTNYINTTPVDPINNASPAINSAKNYSYGYRGYSSSTCANQKGQFYMLVANLENPNDPDLAANPPKECDGSTMSVPATIFFISSN